MQQYAGAQDPSRSLEAADLIASPPVVQNPRADGFGISIAVSLLATALVEYGFSNDDLPFTAVASHHGLIAADTSVLHVRVEHPESLPTDRPIFYRVVVQALSYTNAYSLARGAPQATSVYAMQLPDSAADRIVSINDTHENLVTIPALHIEIEKLQPKLLIWNGDSCSNFDTSDAPEQIMLNLRTTSANHGPAHELDGILWHLPKLDTRPPSESGGLQRDRRLNSKVPDADVARRQNPFA